VPKFTIDWNNGPCAGLDVFSPTQRRARRGADDPAYHFKYNSPFRATVRPRPKQSRFDSAQIRSVSGELDKVLQELRARARNHDSFEEGIEKLQRLGQRLYNPFQDELDSDLQHPGLFLELGLDIELLACPWELMFDGSDFLCMKHSLGRFINKLPAKHPESVDATIGQSMTAVRSISESEEPLSLLVISVPFPRERNGKSFADLDWVREETSALQSIADGVKKNVEVTVLGSSKDRSGRETKGRSATGDNLRSLLAEAKKLKKKYHIIHFSGHATYNEKLRDRSALVLEDEDFTTGQLFTYLKQNPPIFFFANCCEGGRIDTSLSHNIFDLASDILTSGAYFLGSRWRLRDNDAHLFATEFYRALLRSRESIGNSVRTARQKCLEQKNNSWASYVYYGDPRTSFKLID
jgi:CHAT domain-containing protein